VITFSTVPWCSWLSRSLYMRKGPGSKPGGTLFFTHILICVFEGDKSGTSDRYDVAGFECPRSFKQTRVSSRPTDIVFIFFLNIVSTSSKQVG
jgi:hypothetical protein